MSRANTRTKDRLNDDPGAEAIIASAIRSRAQKKGAATAAKKKGRAANRLNKPIHGVDRDTSSANASSRQVDGSDSLDREADVPTQWKRPSSLDVPDPRPGYVQRLVRYKAGNTDDFENIEKAMDQGWRPRERATAKKGHELTARSSGQYGKYYVKRGLMLMEMPVKLAQQRKAFYDRKLKTMTDSVERDLLKDTNSVMPVLKPERKTRVTKAAARGRLDASIPDDDE